MARPGALQFLRKGVLLVGAVFPRFVDTWNWLVGAFDSMCGDRDLNPQNGAIYVDRTDPDKPVIRLDKTRLGDFAGGNTNSFNGRFALKLYEEQHTATYFNCYVSVGGKTFKAFEDGAKVADRTTGIDALVVGAAGSLPTFDIVHYATFSAMKSAQEDISKYIMPIYEFEGHTIKCDFRIGPDAAMWEF